VSVRLIGANELCHIQLLSHDSAVSATLSALSGADAVRRPDVRCVQAMGRDPVIGSRMQRRCLTGALLRNPVHVGDDLAIVIWLWRLEAPL
jgi:hypothetical protein